MSITKKVLTTSQFRLRIYDCSNAECAVQVEVFGYEAPPTLCATCTDPQAVGLMNTKPISDLLISTSKTTEPFPGTVS